MHWSALPLAAQLYDDHGQYDAIYDAYWQDPAGPRDWWLCGSPTPEQTNRVLLFVNQWRSRVTRNPESVASLCGALSNAKHSLDLLRHERLDACVLDHDVLRRIEAAYEAILQSLSKTNATAASKILHMFNSALLVPWDHRIRIAYAVGPEPSEYARKFVPRIQYEVCEAVGMFASDKGVGLKEAADTLSGMCGRPLAKTVDEYNFCRYTLRLDALWP